MLIDYNIISIGWLIDWLIDWLVGWFIEYRYHLKGIEKAGDGGDNNSRQIKYRLKPLDQVS